ncbi:Uncharacterised protein [Mycobacteroides abscessus subsp. abscessus]|nr:Uncharacterised protein [Mycobacteroides abscessus subsp. abscessus]
MLNNLAVSDLLADPDHKSGERKRECSVSVFLDRYIEISCGEGLFPL